ncbi:MAG: alkaline phosphatase family protein [Bdellovibrio sp.]|nr:alkaline phosphatase family protein [Bdellovibrio sp.]
MRSWFFTLLCATLFISELVHAKLTLTQFQSPPKLVVVIVIDQFRADYLTRFKDKFIKPKTKGEIGGFQFLMSEGAYYPFAEYDVLQSMTCPGHAMISTGSYPVMMGIPLNDWYDRKTKKMRYCAEDDEFGISPRALKTTTVGDELKNAGYKSKVIGIALKDRSAVMLAGHRADLALWMDYKTFTWRTSDYYTKNLPPWVLGLNKKLQADATTEKTWSATGPGNGLSDTNSTGFQKKFKPNTKLGLSLNYGVQVSFDAATEALKSENLGHGPATDILALSLSTHDMLGHLFGPNAREVEELTIYEDQQIAKFLKTLKKHMGSSFKDVVVVLTADHGVAPSTDYAQKSKLSSGKLDYLDLYKKIYSHLNNKFGTSSKGEWIAASHSFQFYINQVVLDEKKLKKADVEKEFQIALQDLPGVFAVATASDIQNGQYPPGFLAEQLKKQYIPGISGDVIIIPRPFFMEKDENFATHMTGFSYDRMVPLVLFGKNIQPAVHPEQVHIVDLAPTLSFLLGVLPPATSSGRVLKEIF